MMHKNFRNQLWELRPSIHYIIRLAQYPAPRSTRIYLTIRTQQVFPFFWHVCVRMYVVQLRREAGAAVALLQYKKSACMWYTGTYI